MKSGPEETSAAQICIINTSGPSRGSTYQPPTPGVGGDDAGELSDIGSIHSAGIEVQRQALRQVELDQERQDLVTLRAQLEESGRQAAANIAKQQQDLNQAATDWQTARALQVAMTPPAPPTTAATSTPGGTVVTHADLLQVFRLQAQAATSHSTKPQTQLGPLPRVGGKTLTGYFTGNGNGGSGITPCIQKCMRIFDTDLLNNYKQSAPIEQACMKGLQDDPELQFQIETETSPCQVLASL